MNEVVFKTLKQKDFIVKSFILKVATELDLTLSDTILLIYLSNQEVPVLDIENIMNTCYLTQTQVLESFEKLTSLQIIQVNVQKNRDGKIEEILSLDNMIKTVTQDITTDIKKKNTLDLFEKFESEFGRTLSSMEYEIVNQWVKEGFEKDMIVEALREAVYNNAKSLKYIEAILYSWKDKGYKTPSDIHNGLVEYSDKTEVNDIPNVDWLNED